MSYPYDQGLIDELEALREERDRAVAHTADLVRRTADAVRRAHKAGMAPVPIAELVGVGRQQVHNYINGVTAPEEKR